MATVKEKIAYLYSSSTKTHASIIKFYRDDIMADIMADGTPLDKAIQLFENELLSIIKLGREEINDTINRLVEKQINDVDTFNIEYGGIRKILAVKNNQIRYDPSQLGGVYQYANRVIFDKVAEHIDIERKNYFIAKLQELIKSADVNANELFEKIKEGNEQAIAHLFSRTRDEISTFFEHKLEKEQERFEAIKSEMARTLAMEKDKLNGILNKADAYAAMPEEIRSKIIVPAVHGLENFSVEYLSFELGELKINKSPIYDQVKSNAAGAVLSFLEHTGEQAVKPLTESITSQRDNLNNTQAEFEKKIGRSAVDLKECIRKAEELPVKVVAEVLKSYNAIASTLPSVASHIEHFSSSLESMQEAFKNKVDEFYSKFVEGPEKKLEAAIFITTLLTNNKDLGLEKLRLVADTPYSQAKLAILSTADGFIQDANNFLDTSKMVLGSLQTLGIIGNSELLEGLSTGLAIAEGAVNAIGSFASGNFVGAITGLVSMFGIGGKDPAIERHKQIMDALKRIDGRLDIIDKKLDKVLENQQRIYELQIKTYEKLMDLEEKIMGQFKLLNTKIDLLDTKLNWLINKDQESRYLNCSLHCDGLELSESNSRLPDYKKAKRYWLGEAYKNSCEDFFVYTNFLNARGGIDMPFLKTVYDGSTIGWDPLEKDQLDQIKDKLISQERFYLLLKNKALKSISSLYSKGKAPSDDLIFSLEAPLHTYSELTFKLSQKTIKKNVETGKIDVKYLSNLVSVEACRQCASLILKSHALLTITNADNSQIFPLDAEFYINIEARSAVAERYLTNILKIINAVICQQNLLSGDFLLEILRSEYKSPVNTEEEKKNLAANNNLLNHEFGGIIYYNFIRYYILKEIENSQSTPDRKSLAGYEFAYNEMDELLMKQTVSFPFPIEYLTDENVRKIGKEKGYIIPAGWYCNIDNQYHSMPHPKELKADEGFNLVYPAMPRPKELKADEGINLVYPNDMAELRRYRDLLVSTIESYRSVRTFTGKERMSLYFATSVGNYDHQMQ